MQAMRGRVRLMRVGMVWHGRLQREALMRGGIGAHGNLRAWGLAWRVCMAGLRVCRSESVCVAWQAARQALMQWAPQWWRAHRVPAGFAARRSVYRYAGARRRVTRALDWTAESVVRKSVKMTQSKDEEGKTSCSNCNTELAQ
jgi:hypothetical protein